MSALASQITSLTVVYSTVYSTHGSKKTSKLRVTGLCVGNSPVTGEFPAQRASNAENVSISWRHHDIYSGNWIGQHKRKSVWHLEQFETEAILYTESWFSDHSWWKIYGSSYGWSIHHRPPSSENRSTQLCLWTRVPGIGYVLDQFTSGWGAWFEFSITLDGKLSQFSILWMANCQ